MNEIVIDTSVVVKWFSRETGTAAALRVRDGLVGGKISSLAPDLLLIELANALRHHPIFGPEDVCAAVQSVAELGIDFVPTGTDLLRTAVDLAFRCEITVYDACFLALAEARGISLVTADEKLGRKAKDRPSLVRLSDFTP